MAEVLPVDFFERDTRIVARELLGKILVRKCGRKTLRGRIVETEAYLGSDDPASHAYRGPSPRSKIMFGPAAVIYVYFIYGNYHMLNLVTETQGKPGAVLIRALEPLDGIETMMKNRHTKSALKLTNGPAKLAIALDVDHRFNGKKLNSRGELFVVNDDEYSCQDSIESGPRIGISKGKELNYRYFIKDNRFVSL